MERGTTHRNAPAQNRKDQTETAQRANGNDAHSGKRQRTKRHDRKTVRRTQWNEVTAVATRERARCGNVGEGKRAWQERATATRR